MKFDIEDRGVTGMHVSYGILSDERVEERFETFAEAVLALDSGDELWLMLDDNPALGLPDSFNRIVYVDDATILTSVMRWREIEGISLPAPTLTLDFVNNTARWTGGMTTRKLYG